MKNMDEEEENNKDFSYIDWIVIGLLLVITIYIAWNGFFRYVINKPGIMEIGTATIVSAEYTKGSSSVTYNPANQSFSDYETKDSYSVVVKYKNMNLISRNKSEYEYCKDHIGETVTVKIIIDKNILGKSEYILHKIDIGDS